MNVKTGHSRFPKARIKERLVERGDTSFWKVKLPGWGETYVYGSGHVDK